jgi:putative heme transporter
MRGRSVRRIAVALVGAGLVVATFAFFLPSIADYGDVWRVVQQISWPWLLALAAVTILNVVTFAPPWMVAMPGLSFTRALEVTQASTAISIVIPAGVAAGAAAAYGMLRRWGFSTREVARAVTLTSLWNQLLNLSYPIVAVFLLTLTGDETALLATVAFVGVAVLGVVVSGLVLVLMSRSLAGDIGDVAARFANWALGKVRKGPVGWGGESFERFRADAGDLLTRRWHALTLASLAGSLSVFLVLLVALRALEVTAAEVSLAEAFAAWALVRMLATIPLTPGGVGVVELGLTGALVAFGGDNAGVVAAVLVYRFLTVVPVLALGLVVAATWRRHRPAEAPGLAETGAEMQRSET